MEITADDLRTIGVILGAIVLVSLLLALILFLTVIRQMRRIRVPPNATFAQTLGLTPFLVVVFIDLLDLGLDVLAAPFAWVILDRLGLKALRGVSMVEALIPGTQFIPTLTLCWFAVRLLGYERIDEMGQPPLR